MRRIPPVTLAGRIMVILLVGLAASHLCRMAIMAVDHSDALALAAGGQLAERLASIVKLLESSGDLDQPLLLSALAGKTLWVSRGKASFLPPGAWPDGRARQFERLLTRSLAPRAVEVRLAYRRLSFRELVDELTSLEDPEAQQSRRIAADVASGHTIQASIRLKDGSWLNATSPVVDNVPFWSVRSLVSIAVLLVVLLAATALAVRYLIRPLERLGRAAERLGADVNAPSLPEIGPVEVREAARAFNGMQRRISRLLDERSQMLAAISHDLRTLLTRLRLHGEFVDDDEQRRRLLRPADEMAEMIDALLAYARHGSPHGSPEAIDVAALLRSVCTDVEDAGFDVGLEAPPEATVEGWLVDLRRAFTNLVTNAVKHGGRADVRVRAGEARLVIEIDDQGSGIPEERHEDVFAPFYRVEQARGSGPGGIGLGLTIARDIIRAHGGDIRLQNRAERGLRVITELPRCASFLRRERRAAS